jgi:surface antigen
MNRNIKPLVVVLIIILISAAVYVKDAKHKDILNVEDNTSIGLESVDVLENKQVKKKAIKPVLGEKVDSYKGVAVFNNGEEYVKSYGKNYSSDGYYYGHKWQCVEFIKRFYYEVKKHRMPNVYGNAKDFFDVKTPHGALNKARGLIQYINGGNVKPESDDIIVFNDTKYGHVAIVTEVGKDYIEVIQQNVYGVSREKYVMKVSNGKYTIGIKRKPAGWLRLKKK